MGRTWLVRGIAATVCAVLAAAWVVGVTGLRESREPSVERPPSSPTPSVEPVDERSAAPGKVKLPRARDAGRTQDPTTEPDPGSADEPPDDVPGTPDATTPPTTPDSSPDSSPESEEPSDPPPSPDPSDTPDQPSDECTDLISTIDCVLDPITGHP